MLEQLHVLNPCSKTTEMFTLRFDDAPVNMKEDVFEQKDNI